MHNCHLKRLLVLWICLRCDLQLHTEVSHFGSLMQPPENSTLGSHFRSQGGMQSPQPEGVTVPPVSKLRLLTDHASTFISVFGSCRLATWECMHHTCNYEPAQRLRLDSWLGKICFFPPTCPRIIRILILDPTLEGKTVGAWNWPVTIMQCRGRLCLRLHIHCPYMTSWHEFSPVVNFTLRFADVVITVPRLEPYRLVYTALCSDWQHSTSVALWRETNQSISKIQNSSCMYIVQQRGEIRPLWRILSEAYYVSS
jgi:hypothetical protein